MDKLLIMSWLCLGGLIGYVIGFRCGAKDAIRIFRG